MMRSRLLAIALSAVVVALFGCSSKKKQPEPKPEPTDWLTNLPDQPIPVSLGQEPIVNPLNLWEMMIEGPPDHETVGTVGTSRITTADIDRASGELLTRLGDQIYEARDRGWRWMLAQDGLRRAAAARSITVEQLLLDTFAALPEPPAGQLQVLAANPALAELPDPARLDAARTSWRWRRWQIARSVLVARGLDGVRRERAQLMLVDPKFAGPETAVGIIGERPISRRELHLAAGYQEQSLRLEYFHAARMQFRTLVEQLLLKRAAEAAGLEVNAYLARHYARLGPPPKAEVKQWIEEHPEYAAHPHRAADAVRTLREAEAKKALVGELAGRAGGEVRFLLKEPPIDRIHPAPRSPRRAGNPDAEHLLEVLHCVGGPTCSQGNQILVALARRYGDQLRIELGDAFAGHDPQQIRHAVALRCAEAQGVGWKLTERLAISPTSGATEELLSAATEIGAKPVPFRSCLESDRFLPLVAEDVIRAEQLGLEMNILGLWINGARLDELGRPDKVASAIRAAMKLKD